MKIHHKRSRTFYYFILAGVTVFLIMQAMYSGYLRDRAIQMYDADSDSVSIMRLQSLYGREAQLVIMGSSQTERLIATPSVAIAGVPGCSFLTGWEHIVPLMKCEPGSILILEGNSCLHHTTPGVLDPLQDGLFRLTAESPNFSKSSRPSTLVLSHLLSLYLPSTPHSTLSDSPPAQQPLPRIAVDDICKLWFIKDHDAMAAHLEARIEAIREMQRQGYRPCFVFYATKFSSKQSVQREQANLAATYYIAEQTGIPILNYRGTDLVSKLQFSDTHHLKSTARSSKEFRNTLVRDARALFAQ